MSSEQHRQAQALEGFAAATRALGTAILGPDLEQLDRARRRQAECFETLHSVLEEGPLTLEGLEQLAQVASDARAVLEESRRQRDEVRVELDMVRQARATAERSPSPAARFVSRRV